VGEGRKAGAIRGAQMKAASQQKSYPKQNGRHVHRAVAEQKLGRSLQPGETVHHKDGNKQNFAPDNLEVLTGQSAHARIHVAEMLRARKQKHGY
jgi:hypothetical protein